ncbi:hypothetical protein [Botrimarina sp.]|uniref:hypothetical protein n=1 Tax=Botrimarina sp. TaxID=2795802 RepID=UPI0032F012B8
MTRPPAPPSRSTNPFATCWTAPGRLPWIDSAGASVTAVLRAAEGSAGGAAIVGPHGAGKSSLLRALAEPIRRLGRHTATIDAARDEPPAGPAGVLLVEGFERLTYGQRRRRLRRWRSRGLLPIVTLHRPAVAWLHGLPIATRVAPDASLVAELFERLTLDRPTPVVLSDALHSHARHGPDLRSVWFDLYYLHELRRRSERTPASHAA